jgi:hypothetical protein
VDRPDDHPHEPDEPIAQWFQGNRGVRCEMAEQHAGDDGCQNLDIENRVERLAFHMSPPFRPAAPRGG